MLGIFVIKLCSTFAGVMPGVEDRPTTQEEKEVMYSKVAQRLVEMGDLYAQSFSDHEGRGASVVTPPGKYLKNDLCFL